MATIYDVAEAAGVTAATVSNVVTGNGTLDDTTRHRVRHVIEELGYQPSMLARNLSARQSYTLGLIVPNLSNPFYCELAREIESVARHRGYSVFLCVTGSDEVVGRTYLRQLASRQADGVIIMAGAVGLEDVDAAAWGCLPMVLCLWEERDELPALSLVGVDFFRVGQIAAQHLLALGHSRIGVIGTVSASRVRHSERVAGFASTLAAAGVSLDARWLWSGSSSVPGGFAAMESLLHLDDRPTAVFCTNDQMAMGALRCAIDRNVAVPRDMSIVGVDDVVLSEYTFPPLTTVAIPKREIASEAVALLLHRFGKDASQEEQTLNLPPSLSERASTASIGPAIRVEPPIGSAAYPELLDRLIGGRPDVWHMAESV